MHQPGWLSFVLSLPKFHMITNKMRQEVKNQAICGGATVKVEDQGSLLWQGDPGNVLLAGLGSSSEHLTTLQ